MEFRALCPLEVVGTGYPLWPGIVSPFDCLCSPPAVTVCKIYKFNLIIIIIMNPNMMRKFENFFYYIKYLNFTWKKVSNWDLIVKYYCTWKIILNFNL